MLTKRARRLAGLKRGEVVLFELNVDALAPLPSRDNRYDPLVNYPQAEIDISMLFERAAPWSAIAEAARSASAIVRAVEFVDDYRGKGVPDDYKSITLRLRVGEPGRTLTSDEINAAGDAARAALRSRLDARER